MKSGMLAAEAIYKSLTKSDESDNSANMTVAANGACNEEEKPITASEYEKSLSSSWVAEELKVVRNTHAAFHYGLLAGMVHTALSCFITKGKSSK
jgi:electron-transferring-flavoprotein dehydrogenase